MKLQLYKNIFTCTILLLAVMSGGLHQHNKQKGPKFTQIITNGERTVMAKRQILISFFQCRKSQRT